MHRRNQNLYLAINFSILKYISLQLRMETTLLISSKQGFLKEFILNSYFYIHIFSLVSNYFLLFQKKHVMNVCKIGP